VLLDAERFYVGHLKRSWVPGYLAARGLHPALAAQWHIGYAPAGWTALISHLRNLGHDDALIEAAGLARRSSRGTLIDHFRDRVMLAVRDEHGMVAGFIGRARPEAGPAVPKYLNSPETSATRRATCCSACMRLATGLLGAPCPSSSRARSTPSLLPLPIR